MKKNDIIKGCIDFISKREGFKSTKYLDSAGLPTIGIGHLITRKELDSGVIKIGNESVSINAKLTDSQVNTLFTQDLMPFVESVFGLIKRELTTSAYVACISLAYNIGLNAFTKSSLLVNINNNLPLIECAAGFTLYDKVRVNGVLTPDLGLLKRRLMERDLFLLIV
jgi:lysozyme